MPSRRCVPPLVVAALAAVVMLWLFAPVWFGGESFAFRDAAHYYHPLFEWQASEWSAGRVPLWSPYENCGVPSLADTASSVFYPGKLLFTLPLGYAMNYVLYVTGHVALALASSYLLARRWRASVPAAGVCAFSYAFGGNVLFQYCNVVFLVSAAWLPLGLLAADRMLVRRSVASAVLLGAVLALITLGGDPQTTYNLGLAAALYAVLLWRRDRALKRRDARETLVIGVVGWKRVMGHRFVLLSIGAISGALLAAVQILPGVEWSRLSDRAAYARPRSIYEAAEYVYRRGISEEGTLAAAAEGLFGRPRPGTHHADAFNFSVPPWRAAELIWPNCCGTSFPVNRRWSFVIPGRDGLWTPTLYMGLLPFGLALATWRLRRAPARVRWLSWTALLFAIASLGWYGLGWIVHEASNLLWLGGNAGGGNAGGEGGGDAGGGDAVVGSPVGGLYWLMVVLLPSYAYFRYPAKLLVFAALAMSLLAARGFDRWLPRRPARGDAGRRPTIAFLTLAAVSLLLALAAAVFHNGLAEAFTSAPADAIFGPIDSPGAVSVLIASFVQTAFVAGASASLLLLARKWHPRACGLLLLALTALDLAVAHGWMIVSAPRGLWSAPTAVGELLHGDPEQAAYRVHRTMAHGWLPSTIGRTPSSGRFAEVVAWDRGILMPKYHLRGGHRLTLSPGTIENHDYRVLMNVASRYGVMSKGEHFQPHPAVLRALSTRYLLSARTYNYPGALAPHLPPAGLERLPDEVKLQRLPEAFPRAWIVDDVQILEPLTTNEPAVVGRRTRDLLFPNLAVRDLRRTAVVELQQPEGKSRTWQRLSVLNGGSPGDENESDAAPKEMPNCRLVVDEPQRVEIEVELERPGLLVVNDLFYPGWNCSHGEILRTNRTMRGVLLPAGEHRVVFEYRPKSFSWGAGISGLAWLALLACIAGGLIHARRSRDAGSKGPMTKAQ